MENETIPKSSKNSALPLIIVVVVLLLAGVGAFFAMNSRTIQSTQTPKQESITEITPAATENQTAPSDAMMQQEGSVVKVEVQGKNYEFMPKEIRVKKGDTIKITFNNTQGFHNFVIDEFNVRTTQANNPTSETVEFVADKVGTFEYYCSVGQHRQMGMVGKFIVE